MEITHKSPNTIYKRVSGTAVPFEPIENLSKKRPSSTKLDLEKMYEQSLQLAGYYKQLVRENQQLKQQFQRVETVKLNRQNLISTVEKIVEEKSKELNGKHTTNFSWLVFKLNNKIYQLKAKIQAKERAILDLTLSRQSESIRQKQTEIQCLNEIVEFARGQGMVRQGDSEGENEKLSEIKEIVWMQQEIKQKQSQIIEAEKLYQQQEKQVRRLMQELAQRKAELKSIKEMETEYHKAQELYRQQKRKKEQRIAGNKTYLQQLQNQKAEELKKLQALKGRYTTMDQEETAQIASLQLELERLRKDYNERVKIKQETVIKFSQERLPVNRKKQVKRVNFQQVKLIGNNLNYTLALRGVTQGQLGTYFTNESKDQLSIRQVLEILKRFPFSMEKEEEALLVARYAVEDTGDGYFLEDMDTTQSISIIRSILSKLIGEVKVYERSHAEQLRQHAGPVLNKFGRLVQQLLDLKEGNIRETGSCRKQLVSKERMVEALENTLSTLQNQNFLHEEVEFTIFYLFSWSRNLNQLEVSRLFSMVDEEIQWPEQA